MKTNRSSWMVRNLVLALAGAAIFVGVANAQDTVYAGNFTLPFEAQWGGLTLPAGDYSLKLGYSPAGWDTILIEQDGRKLGMVMSRSHNQDLSSKHSTLVVARSDGRARIVALHVEELRSDFNYGVPRGGARVIASAPELIQRIPLSSNGK